MRKYKQIKLNCWSPRQCCGIAQQHECGRDPKALHKITDKLLKNNQQRLPANIEEENLPVYVSLRQQN